MADYKTATTPADMRRIQIQLKKQADHLSHTILEYLRQLGMTGIRTPTPPRPMREMVASVDFAGALIDALQVKVDSMKR